MLSPKSYLTFGEIADLWAAENTGRPFAQNREQILNRFEAGLKNGEFDHAGLTIWRQAKYVRRDDKNWKPEDAGWMPVTRDMLDDTLFRLSDKLNRELWLEGLRTSKENFGAWCGEQGYSRPAFWFGEAGDISDPTRSGMPGRPTAKQLYQPELKRRAEAGLMRGRVSQEARELHHWLKTTYPNVNPGTPKTVENNIRNLHRNLKATNPPE